MSNFLRNFFADESGAAAAEYVLILAIVGAGVAGGAYYLGTKVTSALTTTGNLVESCADGKGTNC